MQELPCKSESDCRNSVRLSSQLYFTSNYVSTNTTMFTWQSTMTANQEGGKYSATGRCNRLAKPQKAGRPDRLQYHRPTSGPIPVIGLALAVSVPCCPVALSDNLDSPAPADKNKNELLLPAPVPQPDIHAKTPSLSVPTPHPPGTAPAEPKASSPASSSGSVEYDETIPDTSGAPPVDVIDALNEALINNPRAAAIRSQFGIVQAGYAAVTQVPNPVFFFDRGMVAEQENRIGPILTSEPPWKLIFRFLIQKHTVDQSRFDLMTQLWQLRADVRRAYTEVVVAQETFKTLNELYDLSFKLETAVRKRYQAGAVPELDAMKARLATSQTAQTE